MVFDCYDIDGDGLDEDVIFWIILETKTILRARYLTQMFPSPTRRCDRLPRAPFPGSWAPLFSIGLLEMMEGVHDLQSSSSTKAGMLGRWRTRRSASTGRLPTCGRK
jgi:hypothetical protein